MLKKKIYLPLVLLVFILLSNTVSASARDITINREKTTLVAPMSGSYQWYYNNKLLSGETSRELRAKHSGTYCVTVTGKSGVTSSFSVTVAVSNSKIIRIFVIGDSTASIYNYSLYPRNGWAQVFQAFFLKDSVQVVDKALSGRSSKSFFFDPKGWVTVLPRLEKGDYLFIQFAHNDEKHYDTSRYTDPYTTYQHYLSIYIDSARAHGAIPVLLTPINRNKWVDSTTLKDTHGNYPPAMRQLASEKNVPLIDITKMTKSLFESLGERYCTDSIFMDIPGGIYPGYPKDHTDNTHMQENGAFNICKLVIEGIHEQDTNAIFSRLEPFVRKAVRIIARPDSFSEGYIKGNGVFTMGDQTTLTAIPNKGYAFSYWTHNGQTVSHNSNYTVTADPTGNVYVAHCIKSSR